MHVRLACNRRRIPLSPRIFRLHVWLLTVLYMSAVPEAIYTMLACARLGAIHCVVFGGFSAAELATRIEDAKPKVRRLSFRHSR